MAKETEESRRKQEEAYRKRLEEKRAQKLNQARQNVGNHSDPTNAFHIEATTEVRHNSNVSPPTPSGTQSTGSKDQGRGRG